MEELGSRFPKAINNLKWILVEDYQEPSLLGDSTKYPANGHAMPKWNAFRLFPKGMELLSHRIQAASNFEGTLIHELTHLIVDDFKNDWKEKFIWKPCYDSDEWEPKKSPDGTKAVYAHKKTGEMAPQWYFPLQPEQCINYYAKQNADEDICESMVAYIYDPELLKRVSPEKFNILQRHDSQRPKPDVTINRVPKEQIKLPKVKPEVVYYFIKEPQP